MQEFNGILVKEEKRDELISSIIQKFADGEYPKRILVANHLKGKPSHIAIEEIKKLELPNSEDLYFYKEYRKILYRTNFVDICKYVEELALEHSVADYLVFDNSTDWLLAITHNDSFMLDWIKEN